ncbi:MAG: PilC/PilY family type IV pilus protein [Pseudomonadota bacterium]
MNSILMKTQWMASGLVLSLLVGTPALADDTELLLLSPTATTPKPNVLFVIDSSGSMGTEQNTREIYDADTDYVGDPDPSKRCDPDMLYWTEVDVVPGCAAANTRVFKKSAFKCRASTNQLSGIGRYTNVMAQYRDGGSGFFSVFLGLDEERWQNLEPGNGDDWVECSKDNGRHGEGGSATELWPQKGGNVAPYTSNEDDAIAWGSWPTSQAVTVWDGNYLNYLANPVFVDTPRIDIVKNVTEVVLNSIENVNVGIMRFNNNRGGPVIKAMTDLDTNRDDIIDAIDTITDGGATPLSETLYEAALYWRGLPAYYGENVDEHATDPDALASSAPFEVYRQPSFDVCAKNFNVVLTDGAPVSDGETPDLVDLLPGWEDAVGYTGCTFDNQGDCLDDIAAYLYDADISTDAGLQQVITHTIGFAIDLDILEETAQRGKGTYFQADNVESLTLALLEIVNNITDRSLSFAAPAVAVNTFNRTQNLNDLYLTTFAAQDKVRWPGNLKKYRIQDGVIVDRNNQPAVNELTGFFFPSAQSYWSSEVDGQFVTKGGAVENMPTPDARRLFTDNTSGILTAASNQLTPDNDDSFSPGDFGLTGSAEEPSIEALIRWARGEDVLDEDSDPDTDSRKFMGDPLHSQPAAIVYGGSDTNPDVVVFTATNDGYVHAIDGSNGQELWAFLPKEHLPNLVKLFFNPDSAFKNYGVDGDIVPVVADRDNDGIIEPADGDFVHILFGMRRGGSSYYSLDVTDKNNPKVNWRIAAPAFGQSWSRPTVARIDMPIGYLSVANRTDKGIVIMGGGYDTVHDTITHPATPDTQGAGIYMLDLQTGELLWRAGPDDDADLTLDPGLRPGFSRSIPNQIRVIDLNGDGFADRMYASDLGGQLLRFDIFNGRPPDGNGLTTQMVTGGVIAQLGAEGLASPADSDTRRFYNAPDVSLFNDTIQNRRFIAVSIGSGHRASPLDNRVGDRFFSVRDKDVFNQLTQDDYDNYAVVRDTDLIEVSGSIGTTVGANKRGWQFTLPANQKVLATSVTFNNEVFFVAFSPDNASAATCSAGVGDNFLYRVAVSNGDPIIDNSTVIVPGEEDQLRVTELAQGGIAPSPRFLFPSADSATCTGDDCSPPPLGCVGVECFDPGFENFPVRTLWTQDGVE